jgi:hypothetical protein
LHVRGWAESHFSQSAAHANAMIGKPAFSFVTDTMLLCGKPASYPDLFATSFTWVALEL